MFAISPTDNNWFKFLKQKELNSYVNFWTPTPWNIKGLKSGVRLYFMLKSPTRKIGGFGEFVEYKNLTVDDAWDEFGFRNGRNSKNEFSKSIQDYIEKNSKIFGDKLIESDFYKIGCIVLKNCEFWDESEYKSVSDYDVEFAPQVVTIKYYNAYDPFRLASLDNNIFNLINEPRESNKYEINSRKGQGVFKGQILKAYNNSCCVTGEVIPELLEAAHIQSYKNNNSNHIQNGLLLRVDIHRLFDNNLIFIDKEYTIYVSPLIKNENYRKYHGNKIKLPDYEHEYPSSEALELRRTEFRR